jgi:hypothetical protein
MCTPLHARHLPTLNTTHHDPRKHDTHCAPHTTRVRILILASLPLVLSRGVVSRRWPLARLAHHRQRGHHSTRFLAPSPTHPTPTQIKYASAFVCLTATLSHRVCGGQRNPQHGNMGMERRGVGEVGSVDQRSYSVMVKQSRRGPCPHHSNSVRHGKKKPESHALL